MRSSFLKISAILAFVVFIVACLYLSLYYMPQLEKAFNSQWPGNSKVINAIDIIPSFVLGTVLAILAMIALMLASIKLLMICEMELIDIIKKLRWYYIIIGVCWQIRQIIHMIYVVNKTTHSGGTYLYTSYFQFLIIYDLIAFASVSLILCSGAMLIVRYVRVQTTALQILLYPVRI